MFNRRIIPALLLNEDRLIKTVNFKNESYIGDPLNAIKIFNDKEVDELILLDIWASRRTCEPNYSAIKLFAEECFMPLCYGGGVNSLEHAQKIFDLGVEKISIQSAALRDLEIINQIANRFGSQSLVLSVDVKRNWLNNNKLFDSKARKILPREINIFIREAIEAGVGEILLNSVECDGTMAGMDCDLIADIAQTYSIPVIAMGGVGSLEHIEQAINAGASAVAVGSFFVYHGPHKAVLINYPHPNLLEHLICR